MATAKITTDHDTIREWAEARGGRPAQVSAPKVSFAVILAKKKTDYGRFPGRNFSKSLMKAIYNSIVRSTDLSRLASYRTEGRFRIQRTHRRC
jgi:hypothetical protein